MPNKPLRPCAKLGCRNLTRGGYCAEHTHHQARQESEPRQSAHLQGYTYRYNKACQAFLSTHPWYVECAKLCEPGGMILDPFAGSGSTLEAAYLEGHSAIGIEVVEAIAEAARERIMHNCTAKTD